MAKTPTLFGQMPVVGDPMRSRLLLLLERNELTVGELCSVVQAPQSTVSRHLKALSDGGWLTARVDGTNRRYAIAVGGLHASLRSLWLLVRKETVGTLAAAQDERRLTQVLATRRSRSEEFFRAGASQWDQLRDELFGARFFFPALLGLLDEQAVVADLGCGTGQVADALAPFVGQVIGIDSSHAMLKAAKKRLAHHDNVEVRAGTLEAVPIGDGVLDAAMMILVLHHIADPARAVAEAGRILKPGGRIVVLDMLPHDRDEYRARMGHLWLGFGETDVLDTLRAAGFDHARLQTLPSDPKAKGPTLFAARAVKPDTRQRQAQNTARRTR
jgi:ubiquinone/menaquinone biosynthesis C-methylase UbiE/DNA-binding transcriptional ArsR family regulator